MLLNVTTPVLPLMLSSHPFGWGLVGLLRVAVDGTGVDEQVVRRVRYAQRRGCPAVGVVVHDLVIAHAIGRGSEGSGGVIRIVCLTSQPSDERLCVCRCHGQCLGRAVAGGSEGREVVVPSTMSSGSSNRNNAEVVSSPPWTAVTHFRQTRLRSEWPQLRHETHHPYHRVHMLSRAGKACFGRNVLLGDNLAIDGQEDTILLMPATTWYSGRLLKLRFVASP